MSDSRPTQRPDSREAFARALIEFIQGPLFARHGARPMDLDAFTPLFETGIIDSLGIIDLLAFVETGNGQAGSDAKGRPAVLRDRRPNLPCLLERDGAIMTAGYPQSAPTRSARRAAHAECASTRAFAASRRLSARTKCNIRR